MKNQPDATAHPKSSEISACSSDRRERARDKTEVRGFQCPKGPTVRVAVYLGETLDGRGWEAGEEGPAGFSA
jgi:hypothetical protein